ncbi:hypothetical protein E6C60_2775 [Paenibacillus algicola]|uniref:Uncharacterized protein n=1 Tax=Paenibacillus algicola TaxID=2565926 RepID=A0A4P8XL50_9BACL|nr:hypothetical protein E6C60_2775 [Paenibacillus algicola]
MNLMKLCGIIPQSFLTKYMKLRMQAGKQREEHKACICIVWKSFVTKEALL